MKVNDGTQVHKSFSHGKTGDVSRPYLVQPAGNKALEQIGIHFVLFIALTGIMTPKQRLPFHDALEPSGPFTIDVVALLLQLGREPPDAIKKGFEILLVHQAHDD